jgi:hypothetical protein
MTFEYYKSKNDRKSIYKASFVDADWCSHYEWALSLLCLAEVRRVYVEGDA